MTTAWGLARLPDGPLRAVADCLGAADALSLAATCRRADGLLVGSWPRRLRESAEYARFLELRAGMVAAMPAGAMQWDAGADEHPPPPPPGFGSWRRFLSFLCRDRCATCGGKLAQKNALGLPHCFRCTSNRNLTFFVTQTALGDHCRPQRVAELAPLVVRRLPGPGIYACVRALLDARWLARDHPDSRPVEAKKKRKASPATEAARAAKLARLTATFAAEGGPGAARSPALYLVQKRRLGVRKDLDVIRECLSWTARAEEEIALVLRTAWPTAAAVPPPASWFVDRGIDVRRPAVLRAARGELEALEAFSVAPLRPGHFAAALGALEGAADVHEFFTEARQAKWQPEQTFVACTSDWEAAWERAGRVCPSCGASAARACIYLRCFNCCTGTRCGRHASWGRR